MRYAEVWSRRDTHSLDRVLQGAALSAPFILKLRVAVSDMFRAICLSKFICMCQCCSCVCRAKLRQIFYPLCVYTTTKTTDTAPCFQTKKWNAVVMWSWDICADAVRWLYWGILYHATSGYSLTQLDFVLAPCDMWMFAVCDLSQFA
jgi:hypothetical protein